VAGRAGAVRAMTQSMPPHIYPRRDRRKPAAGFCTAGEVIDFALVAVCGLGSGFVGRVAGRAGDNERHGPKHAVTRPPPAKPPEAHAEMFCRRRSHLLGACDGLRPKKWFCFPPVGPLEAHAEVLCPRRRRWNCGSNMRRRWCARREAIGQVHRRKC
jgi:hypothetical protein